MSPVQELVEALRNGRLRSAVFSQRDAVGSPSDRSTGANAPSRVTLRPVSVRGEVMGQFESRQGPQVVHDNVSMNAVARRVEELLRDFRQIVVRGRDEDAHWSRSRDLSWRVKRTAIAPPPGSQPMGIADEVGEVDPLAHNRVKEYLIPEGVPLPFLVAIGVMTAEGKVRSAMYRKFRQINRFLELVRDIAGDLPTEGTLRVVDFGCGKSYLTFALHHLLTKILGRTVEITGVDRKESVVADCSRLAESLACEGLRFVSGEIRDFSREEPVDLAISLHACDTATDDALALAVGWQARVILAVPCCQHELAPRIDAAELRPLLQHGLLRERFASLATDGLRALWLETRGYRTQLVEFIDTEHTPKNVLIRAVRGGNGRGREAAMLEYGALQRFLGLEATYLDRLPVAASDRGNASSAE
jgi:hypothetical protein